MKLFRKILPLLLSFCLLIPVTLPASAAESSNAAKVVVSASEPDSNGLFTVSVTAYNATFDTFQYSFNFDKSVVAPASWSSGEATTDFAAFAKAADSIQDAIYEGYMPKGLGLINTVGLNVSKAYTAGSDGLLLFSYRFKTIAEGSSGIALATSETGNPYNEVISEGGQLLRDDASVKASYIFVLPAALTGGKGDVEETAEAVMTKAQRTKDTLILQIGNYAAAKDGALCHIYTGEKQITPYIKTDGSGNGRTMVPARFIAEKLGAQVEYNGQSKTISILMNDTVIKMTIGSNTYTVNGVKRTMDAAAEIKACGDGSGNGRTMVPMRFVADALGKAVYWDEADKLVIITEADAPWKASRNAEKELTQDVLLITSPLLRDIIK